MDNTKFRIANVVPPNERPHWTRALSDKEMLEETAQRARRHIGDGFRLKKRGDEDFGPRLDLKNMLKRVDQREEHLDFGDRLVVVSLEDDFKFWIRSVKVKARIVDTIGNKDIDKIHSGLWDWNPNLESWGICNRRYIAGTKKWSQHSPWKDGPMGKGANAEDIYAKSKAAGDEIVRALHRMKVPVGLILWWEDDHFDHVHYEGHTQRGGTPARSC